MGKSKDLDFENGESERGPAGRSFLAAFPRDTCFPRGHFVTMDSALSILALTGGFVAVVPVIRPGCCEPIDLNSESQHPQPMVKSSPPSIGPRLPGAVLCLFFGGLALALSLQTVLGDAELARNFISPGLWERLVRGLGAAVGLIDDRMVAQIDFGPLFVASLAASLAAWLGGAAWIQFRSHQGWRSALADWGRLGWCWWLVPGLWEIMRILAFLLDWTGWQRWLMATPHFWFSLALAGWLATLLTLSRQPEEWQQPGTAIRAGSPRTTALVWVAAGLYVVIFTAMNWQLYRGLLIPHGDSAMYEEHLWNLTHGKGFRSYLDQGLFWGEHIQVIHLLLIPLHRIWPSHMLLEFCESLALASGAIPVFWLARRHTGSPRAAALLACAYLLYFPLQFLDISVDLKTFRPIAFGVPLVLFALDRLERGRSASTIGLLLLALSAKEDYALIIAPLGVWIAVRQSRFLRMAREPSLPVVDHDSQIADRPSAEAGSPGSRQRPVLLGTGMAVFGLGYLLLATRVVIPYFRSGDEVHYARYFSKFGDSLTEIAWTMLSDPQFLLGELLTLQTAIYALALLLPLGCLPFFSPGRLLVAVPLFGLLCLNEIAQDPRHHFHAPLVPILFWAAAAGLGQAAQVWHRSPAARRWRATPSAVPGWTAHFAWTSALATGLFLSLGPLSLAFWDADSSTYWRRLYIPGKRAEMFPRVFEQIPRDARVASTDFVHPRFTHHERSYDYSHYRRKVSNYRLQVPDDTDYIVIDTQHPYSEIQSPEQIREYREHPEQWELLPDVTDGYFIVLKRVRRPTLRSQ